MEERAGAAGMTDRAFALIFFRDRKVGRRGRRAFLHTMIRGTVNALAGRSLSLAGFSQSAAPPTRDILATTKQTEWE